MQEKRDCVALTIETCSNRTTYADSVLVTKEAAVKNAENVAENASKIFEIAVETREVSELSIYLFYLCLSKITMRRGF